MVCAWDVHHHWVLCHDRWWVVKMKWGRQEPEEEMDERQEVELLGSKGIPDLETEICFWWLVMSGLKLPLESICDGDGFFGWIIGRGRSKFAHHLVSNSMTHAAHMSDRHIYKQSSRMSGGGGSWPCTNSSVSFATEYGTFSQNGRIGQKKKQCPDWAIKAGTWQEAWTKSMPAFTCGSMLTQRKPGANS